MRISDWSSDVCSSDLRLAQLRGLRRDLLIKGNDVIDRALDRAFEILAADLEHAPRRNAVGDQDRKSVVSGKSVSVRVDLGGRRIIKKKKHNNIEIVQQYNIVKYTTSTTPTNHN